MTVELFPRPLAGRPDTGGEIAYRVLNLLQVGKLEPVPMPGVAIAEWVRVAREPLPKDGVSGQFDYSPERVERLMAQGRDAATAALRTSAAPV